MAEPIELTEGEKDGKICVGTILGARVVVWPALALARYEYWEDGRAEIQLNRHASWMPPLSILCTLFHETAHRCQHLAGVLQNRSLSLGGLKSAIETAASKFMWRRMLSMGIPPSRIGEAYARAREEAGLS